MQANSHVDCSLVKNTDTATEIQSLTQHVFRATRKVSQLEVSSDPEFSLRITAATKH